MNTTELDLTIPVSFQHRLRFTADVFSPDCRALAQLIEPGRASGHVGKIAVVVDGALLEIFPELEDRISGAIGRIPNCQLGEILAIRGGEAAKGSSEGPNFQDGRQPLTQIVDLLARQRIDRHSYLIAIGGGAVLDVAGFAAATVHRGVRLIRVPTTTLGQADSGVGVKCGVNFAGQKNFLGSFAVPWAVINDAKLLHSQPAELRREGLIEAIKVSLVKDADYFAWLEQHAGELRGLEPGILEEAVRRSALLHARHIACGGDPFEHGSSRPLDYGHWAAHKLEQMSDFQLTHGQAVAIGLALDTYYAHLAGLLELGACERVLALMERLGFEIWHPLLSERQGDSGRLILLDGLGEFREHLGGRLTLLMLRGIGRAEEVHEINGDLLAQSIAFLKQKSRSTR